MLATSLTLAAADPAAAAAAEAAATADDASAGAEAGFLVLRPRPSPATPASGPAAAAMLAFISDWAGFALSALPPARRALPYLAASLSLAAAGVVQHWALAAAAAALPPVTVAGRPAVTALFAGGLERLCAGSARGPVPAHSPSFFPSFVAALELLATTAGPSAAATAAPALPLAVAPVCRRAAAPLLELLCTVYRALAVPCGAAALAAVPRSFTAAAAAAEPAGAVPGVPPSILSAAAAAAAATAPPAGLHLGLPQSAPPPAALLEAGLWPQLPSALPIAPATYAALESAAVCARDRAERLSLATLAASAAASMFPEAAAATTQTLLPAPRGAPIWRARGAHRREEPFSLASASFTGGSGARRDSIAAGSGDLALPLTAAAASQASATPAKAGKGGLLGWMFGGAAKPAPSRATPDPARGHTVFDQTRYLLLAALPALVDAVAAHLAVPALAAAAAPAAGSRAAATAPRVLPTGALAETGAGPAHALWLPAAPAAAAAAAARDAAAARLVQQMGFSLLVPIARAFPHRFVAAVLAGWQKNLLRPRLATVISHADPAAIPASASGSASPSALAFVAPNAPVAAAAVAHGASGLPSLGACVLLDLLAPALPPAAVLISAVQHAMHTLTDAAYVRRVLAVSAAAAAAAASKEAVNAGAAIAPAVLSAAAAASSAAATVPAPSLSGGAALLALPVVLPRSDEVAVMDFLGTFLRTAREPAGGETAPHKYTVFRCLEDLAAAAAPAPAPAFAPLQVAALVPQGDASAGHGFGTRLLPLSASAAAPLLSLEPPSSARGPLAAAAALAAAGSTSAGMTTSLAFAARGLSGAATSAAVATTATALATAAADTIAVATAAAGLGTRAPFLCPDRSVLVETWFDTAAAAAAGACALLPPFVVDVDAASMPGAGPVVARAVPALPTAPAPPALAPAAAAANAGSSPAAPAAGGALSVLANAGFTSPRARRQLFLALPALLACARQAATTAPVGAAAASSAGSGGGSHPLAAVWALSIVDTVVLKLTRTVAATAATATPRVGAARRSSNNASGRALVRAPSRFLHALHPRLASILPHAPSHASALAAAATPLTEGAAGEVFVLPVPDQAALYTTAQLVIASVATLVTDAADSCFPVFFRSHFAYSLATTSTDTAAAAIILPCAAPLAVSAAALASQTWVLVPAAPAVPLPAAATAAAHGPACTADGAPPTLDVIAPAAPWALARGDPYNDDRNAFLAATALPPLPAAGAAGGALSLSTPAAVSGSGPLVRVSVLALRALAATLPGLAERASLPQANAAAMAAAVARAPAMLAHSPTARAPAGAHVNAAQHNISVFALTWRLSAATAAAAAVAAATGATGVVSGSSLVVGPPPATPGSVTELDRTRTATLLQPGLTAALTVAAAAAHAASVAADAAAAANTAAVLSGSAQVIAPSTASRAAGGAVTAFEGAPLLSATLDDHSAAAAALLSAMTAAPLRYAAKLWRREAWEHFTSPAFFASPVAALVQWRPVIARLIDRDLDRDKRLFFEVLDRCSSRATWGFVSRDAELLSRARNLRRVAFIVLSGRFNEHVRRLPAIADKVMEALRVPRESAPAVTQLHTAALLLTRAAMCSVAPSHLASWWPAVITEIVGVLQAATPRAFDYAAAAATGSAAHAAASSGAAGAAPAGDAAAAAAAAGAVGGNGTAGGSFRVAHHPHFLALLLEACKVVDFAQLLVPSVFHAYSWAFAHDTFATLAEDAVARAGPARRGSSTAVVAANENAAAESATTSFHSHLSVLDVVRAQPGAGPAANAAAAAAAAVRGARAVAAAAGESAPHARGLRRPLIQASRIDSIADLAYFYHAAHFMASGAAPAAAPGAPICVGFAPAFESLPGFDAAAAAVLSGRSAASAGRSRAEAAAGALWQHLFSAQQRVYSAERVRRAWDGGARGGEEGGDDDLTASLSSAVAPSAALTPAGAVDSPKSGGARGGAGAGARGGAGGHHHHASAAERGAGAGSSAGSGAGAAADEEKEEFMGMNADLDYTQWLLLHDFSELARD